jgi:acid phosphatase type 7
MFKSYKVVFALILALLFSGCEQVKLEDSSYIVFTWTHRDTSRTLTINYRLNKESKEPSVYFDTVSREGKVEDYTYNAKGDTSYIRGLDNSWAHQVQLKKLLPNTTYYLIAGDKESGFTKERKIKTLPADKSEVSFINGGDMGTGFKVVDLLKGAAGLEPDFAVIGGDIAYGNGKVENAALWITWMQNWDKYMVTPKGYSVPFMAAVGNHEVGGGLGKPAPFFKKMLKQDKHSYFLRKVGSHAVFFLLDTGHLSWYIGPQYFWMKQKIKKYRKLPYKFAVYHIPFYPVQRDYDLFQAKLGRKLWAPIFEKYFIHTAFEHHDHALKRTHFIKDEKIVTEAEGGILYLGDGCFGKGARQVDASRWYLAEAKSTPHFWHVTVNEEGVVYEAFDPEGKSIDYLNRKRINR